MKRPILLSRRERDRMIRTGYCGTKMHERCLTVVENGAKANERYVLCSCACHDGNQESLSQFMATVGVWPVAEPLNASQAEMSRYVDQVNAILNPRAVSEQHNMDEEELDD